jgi:hypothetical protein
MSFALATALRQLVESESMELTTLDPASTGLKPRSGGWSQREELGHLIDSASNNHMRFVLATLASGYRGPYYQQDAWVELHGYNEMGWDEIITYWRSANFLMARLVRRIPETALSAACEVGSDPPVTLRFLIEDYILHMRHHLDHILRRPVITAYPAAGMPAHP